MVPKIDGRVSIFGSHECLSGEEFRMRLAGQALGAGKRFDHIRLDSLCCLQRSQPLALVTIKSLCSSVTELPNLIGANVIFSWTVLSQVKCKLKKRLWKAAVMKKVMRIVN